MKKNRKKVWIAAMGDIDLEKGDVIIFRHDGKLLVKRIAAIGGEYVERDGEFLLVPEGLYGEEIRNNPQ